MYEEDIEELDKWFDKDYLSCETSHYDDEYIVDQTDVDDFCDYLREEYPDLIGIKCMVGTGGIWFKREDLIAAKYL